MSRLRYHNESVAQKYEEKFQDEHYQKLFGQVKNELSFCFGFVHLSMDVWQANCKQDDVKDFLKFASEPVAAGKSTEPKGTLNAMDTLLKRKENK